MHAYSAGYQISPPTTSASHNPALAALITTSSLVQHRFSRNGRGLRWPGMAYAPHETWPPTRAGVPRAPHGRMWTMQGEGWVTMPPERVSDDDRDPPWELSSTRDRAYTPYRALHSRARANQVRRITCVLERETCQERCTTCDA